MHAMARSLRVGRRHRDGEAGQSLVEFSLVLMPLFLVLLGIIQFGFVFNGYVTVANATREAAREGSIYLYDRTLTKAQNDAARNAVVRTTLLNSLNLLKTTSPQLTTSTSWTQSGDTFTTGDLTVTYYLPETVEDSMPRTGQRLTVRVRYHQDIVVPLIGALLPLDPGGRFVLTGEVTMVIN
jgi:Flp pilus assembly protein TadG